MAYVATSGYAMNFATNDLAQIRAYLAQKAAPSDYTLFCAARKNRRDRLRD